MAKLEIKVPYADDMTPVRKFFPEDGEGVAGFVIGLGGEFHELDLCNENLAGLRELLAPYIKAARPRPTYIDDVIEQRGLMVKARLANIRKVAIANRYRVDGKLVSDKGQIPAGAIDQYYKENPDVQRLGIGGV